MKIAGIIAEYNPFHNGHAWHIECTRARTGCDWVIVCMSGHFTQRGEPVILSKWARARMALSAGADAVFELPALFAVRTADAFARGGVTILDGLGVDVLSFGSEIGDEHLLHKLSALRTEEPEALSLRIRENLKSGMSHVNAWGKAVAETLGFSPEELNRPNAMLSVEYLRAIDSCGSHMQAVVIPRIGDYHNEELSGLPSATAVRAALRKGDTAAALQSIPLTARAWAVPEAMHPMDDLLLFRLREMSLDQLAALPDIAEGLENRIYRECRRAGTREQLLDAVKCRRYTRARLSRVLTCALLGVDRMIMEDVPVPTYARLLGVRAGAEPLLEELSARSRLPILSRATEMRGDPCFALECRATDLWSLLHDDPQLRRSGREYTEKFIRL